MADCGGRRSGKWRAALRGWAAIMRCIAPRNGHTAMLHTEIIKTKICSLKIGWKSTPRFCLSQIL